MHPPPPLAMNPAGRILVGYIRPGCLDGVISLVVKMREHARIFCNSIAKEILVLQRVAVRPPVRGSSGELSDVYTLRHGHGNVAWMRRDA